MHMGTEAVAAHMLRVRHPLTPNAQHRQAVSIFLTFPEKKIL